MVGSQRGSFRPQMGMGRPGPYDRHDRYSSPGGAGMGGPMGAGFNRGRGSRNLKGNLCCSKILSLTFIALDLSITKTMVKK